MTADAVIPGIEIDTPDSPSPDEDLHSISIKSDPSIHFTDADFANIESSHLRHAYTAPARVESRSSDDLQREPTFQ
jgi:hypothetical protein